MWMDKAVIQEIRDFFINNQLSIAVAESVTSGYLQAALSSAEDASKFFHGGITAYNLGQKSRHLRVNPIHAEEHNCVSQQVAVEMASGAVRLFSADIGMSVTGFAALAPEQGIEHLYAYFAISHKDDLIACKKIIPAAKKQGVPVQLDYAGQIIDKMLPILRKHTFKR
jgi:nicotinamide-nucleotide amidase